MGDDIQSIKAGILEIADILVVNKADRPGADQSVRYLKSMIEMGYRPLATSVGKHRLAPTLAKEENTEEDEHQNLWLPPVLKTIASENVGFEELVAQVLNHRDFLKRTGKWQLKEAWTLQEILRKRIAGALERDFFQQLPEGLLDTIMAEVVIRKVSPTSAVEKLLSYNQNR